MRDFKLLWGLLGSQAQRRFVWLLVLTIVSGFVEVLGVGLVIPFIAVASNSLPFGRANTVTRALVEGLQACGVSEQYVTVALGGVFLIGILFANCYLSGFQYYASLVVQEQRRDFGVRVVRVLVTRPMEWLDRRNSAELIKVAVTDVALVVEVVNSFVQVFAVVLRCAVLYGFFLWANARLALGALCVLPAAYFLVFTFIRRPLLAAGRAAQELFGRMSRYAHEVVGGGREIRVGALEQHFLSRFEGAAEGFVYPQVYRTLPGYITRAGLESVTVAVVICMLVYFHLKDGGLNNGLPLLSSYAVAGIRILPALQQGLVYFFQLKFLTPALHQVAEILQEEPDNHQVESPEVTLPLQEEISLEKVSYQYSKEAQILQQISLEIRRGERVAFVGATGAGKSTLFDILLGLRTPTSGCLKIDGVPLNSSLARCWRKGLGYVPQSIYLLDATIAENVAFGSARQDIDLEQVQRACQEANIHEFIEALPGAYWTEVGERGVRLSGGQCQRIGIARALYHNPKVVFFDEATSSLDSVTESSVLQALDRLKGDKTLIVIAHRLNTVWDFDRLFLLQQGCLIAEGSAQDLLVRSPEFRELAQHQVQLAASEADSE